VLGVSQSPPRDPDGGGLDAGMAGESDQQILIPDHIIQYTGQKMPFPGRLAKLARPDAGQGEEPPEPLVVLGDKAKRLNSQDFCHLGREGFLPVVSHLFAFP
jgi:hypothetical protein